MRKRQSSAPAQQNAAFLGCHETSIVGCNERRGMIDGENDVMEKKKTELSKSD